MVGACEPRRRPRAASDAGARVGAGLPAVRLAVLLDGLAERAERDQSAGDGQPRLSRGRVLLASRG